MPGKEHSPKIDLLSNDTYTPIAESGVKEFRTLLSRYQLEKRLDKNSIREASPKGSTDASLKAIRYMYDILELEDAELMQHIFALEKDMRGNIQVFSLKALIQSEWLAGLTVDTNFMLEMTNEELTIKMITESDSNIPIHLEIVLTASLGITASAAPDAMKVTEYYQADIS